MTEDPQLKKQHVRAAKQAAGVGIPTVPKPPVRQQAQTVKEKLESVRQNVLDQQITGPTVKSNVADVVAKKRGALQPKTNFDKADKAHQKITEIVKKAQERHENRAASDAIAEADQLGTLLGSTHTELRPLHRQAIEARAQQLKDLVRNVPTVEDHISRGMKVQDQMVALRERREQAERNNGAMARDLIGGHYGGAPSKSRFSSAHSSSAGDMVSARGSAFRLGGGTTSATRGGRSGAASRSSYGLSAV